IKICRTNCIPKNKVTVPFSWEDILVVAAFPACPDGSTCCKTKDGDWACCPLPEAVCCEDFIHCCPNGQKCNLAAGTCDDGKSSVPWMEKVPAVSKQGAQVQDVPCNSTVSCRDGSTCCKNKDGDWACCPLPEVNVLNKHTLMI
uniref:Granulins domain-containing protein n=1 Tax=Monopterus albus TaxID=43700 RepID=A0A3Q3IST8_MONAL